MQLVLSLDSYNDVLKRQKEKDLEIKHLEERQSNDIKELREEMQDKFEQILLKVNVDKVMKRE